MTRRLTILASAVVAVTPLYFASVSQAADNPAGVNNKVASDPQDQHNELHGVHVLFAHAANAALTEDGIDQLSGFFVAETDGGHALRDAAGNVVASGTVPPPVVNPPVVNPPGDPANQSDHASTVRRFNSDWHAKYHEDFRIGDAGVVFGDITAEDLRMPHRDVGLKLNPPTTQPVLGTTPGAQAAAANRDLNNVATNPADQRTAAGTLIPGTDPNSLKPLSQQMVVHVPGSNGAGGVDVHLMREGPAEFKFVSHGEVDVAALRRAVDQQLASALTDETKWPADVHQAQRAIAQHLFLAISDYQADIPTVIARPAPAPLPGLK